MVSLLSFLRIGTFLILLSAITWSDASGQHVIRGTVMNQAGESLAGASIHLKGSNEGSIADVHGNFVLATDNLQPILEVRYPEYRTRTVAAKGKKRMNIRLTSRKPLAENYIKGYHTSSHHSLSTSISAIKDQQLAGIPSSTFVQQLQGRIPGLMVRNNYQIGGPQGLHIRGLGTLNDNAPLYIIDGIPLEGPLDMISPEHIEQITVLKDAAAAAIYGTRGGNGVVLITTKKGKIGKARLHLRSSYGIQEANPQLSLLASRELGELLYHSQRQDHLHTHAGNSAGFEFQHAQYGTDPKASNFLPDYVFPTAAMTGDPGTDPSSYSASEPWHLITKANTAGTDWLGEIFTPAPIQNHILGVSGGSKYASYYMGLNYFDQQGIIRETGFQRFSLRANGLFSPTPWLRLGETMEVSHGRSVIHPSDLQSNPIAQGIRMHPLIPVYDIQGNFAGTKGAHLGNIQNPVAQLHRNRHNVGQHWKLLGSAFMEIDLFKNLRFKSQIGLDYHSLFANTFTIRSIEHAEPAASNSLRIDHQNTLNWTLFNFLDYRWKMGKVHTLQVLAGQEASEGVHRYLYGARDNFYSDDLSYRFLNAGTTGIDNGHGGSEHALSSFFGHASYTLLGRYLLEANIRRDGSSRFGPNHLYGLFYGGSIGWRLSEELFLLAVPGLDDLTIRASWGQTGNHNIADYAAYSTYRSSLSSSSYDIWGSNQHVVSGFDSERFGNPNIKWEHTRMLNLGLDLGLFRSFRLQVDGYRRTTTDMLFVPALSGVQGEALAPYRNQGEMINSGVDLSLSFQRQLGAYASLQLQANVSGYRNELVSLGKDAADYIPGPILQDYSYTRSVPGYPVSSFWGLAIDGFITETEVQNGQYDAYYDRPGRFRYVDQNQDGLINEEDQIYLGSPHPDIIYGMSGSIQFLQFDVKWLIQGMFGNEVLNYTKAWTDFAAFQSNRSQRMLHASWTPESADEALLPVLSQSDVLSHQPSSYFIEDGSYMRLKQAEFGYSIGELRLYAQAINLLTFTGYQGLDPEVQGHHLLMGLDRGSTPAPRTILFGMNFGF